MQELLSVAYRYQQQELFHKLLAAALDSTAAPEPAAAVTVSSHDHGLDYLVATAAVLDAVSKLHDTPGGSHGVVVNCHNRAVVTTCPIYH